ncbi:unnamed protein product [Cylicocyclus nassatus]|uniref:G-patch domain-containing protein n=1 Tax=Cylicocyclus nassatus TaxID=53992 RepID=A0AA36DUD0_CYLNA|nr:unnamed protein product [Cylicocyclus nassatus]
MSILAEPRRKQRLSIDPRNLQWKNDQDKFSQKLMKKMGWSEGEGLGRNLQGSADHVKLKANYTGKGLGADKLALYDSTWIGHHDDFADLLNALNKNKKEKVTTEEEKEERAKRISLELSSKSLRRRIHYQKFTRAKDTSNYTESDRAAILGIVHKPETESPQKDETKEEKSPIKKEEEVELKSNTTVSSMSVGEYFAAKMAAMKAKSEQGGSEDKTGNVKLEDTLVKEEITEQETEEERKEKKKKRKEKKRLFDSVPYEISSEFCQVKIENMEEEEAVENEEEQRRQRKKEKKLKRRQERERLEMEGDVKRLKVEEVCEEDEIGGSKEEKKMKDKPEMTEEAEALADESSESRKKKKKKKKNKSKEIRQ